MLQFINFRAQLTSSLSPIDRNYRCFPCFTQLYSSCELAASVIVYVSVFDFLFCAPKAGKKQTKVQEWGKEIFRKRIMENNTDSGFRDSIAKAGLK